MCLILKHTSLAQYGMSHLAKGMVVPVIGSLVVAFSLLCMAKEFTCLLAFQCGDCFNCCCHSYIIFRISIIMLTDTSERRTALAPCLQSLRFSGVHAAQLRLSESNDTCINSFVPSVACDQRSSGRALAVSQPFGCKGTTFISINDKIY